MRLAFRFPLGLVEAATAQGQTEWPLHPDRLHQALLATAALHQPELIDNLKGLEGVPPIIVCAKIDPQTKITKYGQYPLDGSANTMLENTSSFSRPVIFVDPERFTLEYRWPDGLPEATQSAVARLAPLVPYFGASSSVCNARVLGGDESGVAAELLLTETWTPDGRDNSEGPPFACPALGRTAALCANFERTNAMAAQAKEGLRPMIYGYRGGKGQGVLHRTYRCNRTVPTGDRWIAFGIRSAQLIPGARFERVLAKIRSAMFSLLDIIEPALSGHSLDGLPVGRIDDRWLDQTVPHIGFVPLLDVDSPQASGSLVGFALHADRSIRDKLLARAQLALANIRDLRTDFGALTIISDDALRATTGNLPFALQTWRYHHKSTRWETVTPVAISNRYFSRRERVETGLLYPPFTDETIATNIQTYLKRQGLPRATVFYNNVSSVFGAPLARDYPRVKGAPRCLKHLVLEFREPVDIPLIIGPGRWKGFGLCLPR